MTEPIEQVLDVRTKKTLSDVRAVLVIGVGIIVTLFGGGWVALAKVDDRAAQIGRAEAQNVVHELAGEVKALNTRTLALENQIPTIGAEVRDLKLEVTGVRGDVRSLREDLRVALPKLPPVDRDGGTP
ncbi:MAG: hypothetical protein ACOZQL_10585 [Myxococcota bacterium]